MIRRGVLLQEINVVDVVAFLARKNRQFQATLLGQIEELVDVESDEYFLIRKYILDSSNNYNRLVIKTIFGDIETD